MTVAPSPAPLPPSSFTAVQSDRRFEQAWAQYWKTLDPYIRSLPTSAGTNHPATFINITDAAYGGVGDGVTDNTAAWTAVAAAINTMIGLGLTGARVYFPTGKYFFAGAISFTFPTQTSSTNGLFHLSLYGDGPDASVLFFNSASSGMTVTLKNTFTGGINNQSFQADDLAWTTGQTGGSTGLTITQANHNTGDFAAGTTLTNCAFRGDSGYSATAWWTTGVNVHGLSNVNLLNCIFEGGNNAGSFVGTCLAYSGIAATTDVAVVMNCFGCSFLVAGIGFAAGDFIQGLTFTACNFETCTTSFDCPHGLSQQDAQAMFNNCQFGPPGTSNCIVIETAFNNVALNNCIFVFSASTQGGVILGQVSNLLIANCLFDGGGTAIALAAFTVDCAVQIIGNTFGAMTKGISFANLTLGVNSYTATTVALSNIAITGNSFVSTTTPVILSGAMVATSAFSIADNTFMGASTCIAVSSTMNATAAGTIDDNIFMSCSTAMSLGGSTQNISIGYQSYVSVTTKITNTGSNNFATMYGRSSSFPTQLIGNLNGTTGDRAILALCGNTANADATSKFIEFWDPTLAVNPGWINRTSNTTIALTSSSDRRLKTNIKPTQRDSLALLRRIPVQDFEWKNSGERVEGRFVAQNVQRALGNRYPGVVHRGGRDPHKQPWGVDTSFHPLIVHSIQQLAAENEDLRKRLNKIERRK